MRSGRQAPVARDIWRPPGELRGLIRRVLRPVHKYIARAGRRGHAGSGKLPGQPGPVLCCGRCAGRILALAQVHAFWGA